jgi:eukaryotic-like serine/threonine-protein kinase
LGPEFYGTRPVRFSPAADCYAFGATAWFLANKGKLPSVLVEMPPQFSQAAPSFSTAKIPLANEIVVLLDGALAPDPKDRPDMAHVRDSLKKHLLFGRHRVTIHHRGANYVLSEPGKSVKLQIGSDTITIRYDGLAFRVSAVEGSVYLNNTPAALNVSHPEVVL